MLTASAASEYADAVLLLAVAGTTKRRDIKLASERLTTVGAPLVGVLFVEGGGNRGISDGRTEAEVLHSQLSEQTTETSENT